MHDPSSAHAGVGGAVVAALVVLLAPGRAAAVDKPDFQLPFACGERWEGVHPADAQPESLSVDWNRDSNDLGHIAGRIGARQSSRSVVNLGDTSYGRYVVVDHGGGWTTLHAHLLRAFVTVGQRVDQGQADRPARKLRRARPARTSTTSSGSTDPTGMRCSTAVGFDYKSWLTVAELCDVPVVGDWNGDRRSDVGVFGRQPSAAASSGSDCRTDAVRRVVSAGRPTSRS